MHELGIAQNILDIVQQNIPAGRGAAVRRVRVRVGQLSGIVPESLEFCFNAIVCDTDMKRAELVMDRIPTVSRCRDCRNQFEVDDFAFFCPACEGNNLDLISGRELEVVDIYLADDGKEEV